MLGQGDVVGWFRSCFPTHSPRCVASALVLWPWPQAPVVMVTCL